MTKEEKAVAFVEDFLKYGFRIDTMPTRMWINGIENMKVQAAEYDWWHHYVSEAEKRLRDAARKVLDEN